MSCNLVSNSRKKRLATQGLTFYMYLSDSRHQVYDTVTQDLSSEYTCSYVYINAFVFLKYFVFIHMNSTVFVY